MVDVGADEPTELDMVGGVVAGTEMAVDDVGCAAVDATEELVEAGVVEVLGGTLLAEELPGALTTPTDDVDVTGAPVPVMLLDDDPLDETELLEDVVLLGLV